MRARARARQAAAGVVILVGGWMLSVSGPSVADVTAVRGEAYAMSASVSLFGGPAMARGPIAPVTLPPGGSLVPITATAATANAIYGPATIFSSGPANTSTQGTLGAGGAVTSTATLGPVNTSQSEIFTATSISSTCTASETGTTGSTTVTGGTLILQDPNPNTVGETGEDIRTIPTNPAPNTTYTGTVANVNDNFRVVFNEQIVNADGSLTVNAYHLYLLGPTAVGEVIVGHVVCGVTASAVTTTSSTTTTTIPVTTTSSTTTTTVQPTTTSSTTTTTLQPTTTSSTTTTTVNPLICNGQQATIVGTGGPDMLVGTAGPDVIVGLGGDDRISGLGGNDVICGGEGNDLITGGEGNDTVFGGPGNDDLSGDAGNDTLNGEGGVNRLSGGVGTDTCTSGQAAGCEA